MTLLLVPFYFGYLKGRVYENDLTYRLTGWFLFLIGVMKWIFFLFGRYFFFEFPEVSLGLNLFMIFCVLFLFVSIIFSIGAYPFYHIMKGGFPTCKLECVWKAISSLVFILAIGISGKIGLIVFPNFVQFLSEFSMTLAKTSIFMGIIVGCEFLGISFIICYFFYILPVDLQDCTVYSLEENVKNKLRNVKELINVKSGWFYIFLFNYTVFSIDPFYIVCVPRNILCRPYVLFLCSFLLHYIAVAKVLQKKLEGEQLLPYYITLTIFFIGSGIGLCLFNIFNLNISLPILSNPFLISSILSFTLAYRKKIFSF